MFLIFSVHDTALFTFNASQHDAGDYVCQASNNAGKAYKWVTVNVVCKYSCSINIIQLLIKNEKFTVNLDWYMTLRSDSVNSHFKEHIVRNHLLPILYKILTVGSSGLLSSLVSYFIGVLRFRVDTIWHFIQTFSIYTITNEDLLPETIV